MARSRIRINGSTATFATVPIGASVTLTNDGDGDELAFAWVTLFEPPGTSDALSGAGSSTATFTPTKEGSYLIRLTVNGSFSATAIVAVLDARTGERFPSAFETTEAGASGWTGAINRGLAKALHQIADGETLIAVTPGGIAAGHLVTLAGVATVNASTQATFSAAALAAVNATVKVPDRIGVLVDGVTPGDVAAGHLVLVRMFGLVPFSGSGSTTVGSPVYLTDAGTPGLTPGTVTRPIGRVVQAGGGTYQWAIDAPPLGLEPTVINVREAPFLAKGDGVTDDAPAFRAAIAAAKTRGGEIFVPPGIYLVNRDTTSGVFACLLIDGADGLMIRGVRGQSIIKQPAPVGIDATAIALLKVTNSRRVVFRDLLLDGNWGNAQSTISAASHGLTLPQSTINVADATGFPTSGIFELITPTGFQRISYTGRTSTAFTGCTGATPGTVLRGDGDIGRFGYVVGRQSNANTHVDTPSDLLTLPQATLHVGNTVSFPPSGQFLIESDSGTQTVTYTGRTSTTFTGCTGGVGVIHVGGGIWGPNNGLNQFTQRDAQNRAIWLYGKGGDVVDVLITGVDIRQMYGDGIWLGGDGSTGGMSGGIGGTRDVVIRDCTIDMCGRNGITLSYCRSVRVEHCKIRNVITTAIDTEPVNGECVDVVIDGNNCACWWNPWIDPVKNVISIQGGATSTPAEWNYAMGYRVINNRLFGCVIITDAIDVRLAQNSIYCDFDATSVSPIAIFMYTDDVWIDDNYIYARSTDGNEQNIGAIQMIRQLLDGVSATMPAGVHIRGNRIHARNGMDGISLAMPGGGGGFRGTATSVTDLILVETGAGWTANQFAGHQVVCGGVTAVILTNTTDTLNLAPWHADGVHGWTDARGQPVSAPAAGAFTIQPTGGVVEISDNVIDCVAADGRPAGRYGISVDTTTTWNPFFVDARISIERNVIRGANPHGIHVFLYGTPPIRYLSVIENVVIDNQPIPTCTHALFFDALVAFDPVAQVLKLIIRDNRAGEQVENNMGGISQGYWLVEDGAQQRFAGYGSPAGIITAPIGSTMMRKDGGAGSTFYVKESGGLPINGTSQTDQLGSGLILSTDQILTLDAVTTTVDNCLVVQALAAVPGSGVSNWDQWTNTALSGYAQIIQNTDSNGTGDMAAAAGVLAVAGSSMTGTVRQHAASSEFGNGTYSFALKPQVPSVPPMWVANGAQTQGTTGSIAPPWPTHNENDVAIMMVILNETDTGATIADTQWIELPGSPLRAQASGAGTQMHLFGARAYKVGMPAPTVAHSGGHIMATILLFRNAAIGATTGWAAK